MSAPHIQYATTEDGMRIAYWTLGDGEPYIMVYSGNACEKEWEFPEARWAYGELAKDRTVVRLDLRGEGLSSEPLEPPTLDALCRDLDAVVARLGAKRYALHGGTFSTKLMVRHAAQHPDRVSALTLYRPNVAANSAHWENPAFALLRPLLDSQPQLYNELRAVILAGLDDPEFTRRYVELAKAYRYLSASAMHAADVTTDVGQVQAPVLVLHRKTPEFDINVSRAIASSFPKGRLAVVGGTLPMPWDPPVIGAIRPFLAESIGLTPVAEPAAPLLQDGIALIMFADIVDSTALTERMGDSAFRERARALDGLLRTIILESGGMTIDQSLGDGVLATFPVASQGIAAALACASAGDDRELPLHVGLHAGDVIREEGNVFGGAVNIASRISALSAPGEVLVSDTVRSLARTSAGARFEDRGEHVLKGVGDAVRVYAVRWREGG